MPSLSVRITRLRPNVALPEYHSAGAAAFDLATAEDLVVPARNWAVAPTGLVIGTPPGHVLLIFARSSLLKKTGLILGNGVGVIDSDFCGAEDELQILLRNPSDVDITIKQGGRIAQGIILPFPRVTWEEGAPSKTHSRGGWGTSGGYTT